MIVLDASAAVEFALGTRLGRRVADRIEDPSIPLAAPSLLDVEATHAIRSAVAGGRIPADQGEPAIAVLSGLDAERYHHVQFLGRIWGLRHVLTAYDAAYVALAEALGATLLTCDARLCRAPGIFCAVDLIQTD